MAANPAHSPLQDPHCLLETPPLLALTALGASGCACGRAGSPLLAHHLPLTLSSLPAVAEGRPLGSAPGEPSVSNPFSGISPAVCTSWCCSAKAPKTTRLQTTKICSLTCPESPNPKSRCHQGPPSETCRGVLPCLVLASGGHLMEGPPVNKRQINKRETKRSVLTCARGLQKVYEK